MNKLSAESPCWQDFCRELNAHWSTRRWCDVGVVVGCSGGSDSVSLLRGLAQISESLGSKGFLVAAHFNHQLRGQESDADEEFVRSLARELGVRFEVEKGIPTHSDESSLRDARYSFFQRIAEQQGARYVALAHTLDDNVETFLHHLLRGTGPAGLSGIPAHRSLGDDIVLVRPMLHIDRQSARDALSSAGQCWREDSSNQSDAYSRNWIRHDLIPKLLTRYPQSRQSITRLIESQSDWKQVITDLADQWLQRSLKSEAVVTLQRDATIQPPVVIAALQKVWQTKGWPQRDMTAEHWRRLAEAIRGSGDCRLSLPGSISLTASGDYVQMYRESS